MSKNYIFPMEKQRFFQKTPFEDNIDFGFDFGGNLLPCWPPNRRFFEIIAFQEAFKNSSFFASIFLSILGPSWPPTWTHLGGQDGSKSEKMEPTNLDVAPEKLGRCHFMLDLNTTLLLDLVYDRFGVDFVGVWVRLSKIFG